MDDIQDSQFDTVNMKSSKRGLIKPNKSKFSSNLDVSMLPLARRKKVTNVSPLDILPELNKESRSEKSADKARKSSFNRPKYINPTPELLDQPTHNYPLA